MTNPNALILRNHTEICRGFHASIAGLSVEQIKRDVKTSRTPVNLMMRLLRVYEGAKQRAERYGYIGVGRISFAEQRVQRFQRRTLLRSLIEMDERAFRMGRRVRGDDAEVAS